MRTSWTFLAFAQVTHPNGALGGTRTPNLLIRSQMLYPLSYERTAYEYTAASGLPVRVDITRTGAGLTWVDGYSAWIQLIRSSRLTVSSRAGWSVDMCPRIIPTTWSSLSPRATYPHSHRISFTIAS